MGTGRGVPPALTRSDPKRGSFPLVNALAELAVLLRPAGGGVFLVSTGRAEQAALQRRLYGASSDAEIQARFLESLEAIAQARIVLLGIPSDVGAGYRRGANLGPQAIRSGLLDEMPDYPSRATAARIVDLGDVFVVPQLLHDDMLSDAQKTATRASIYRQLSSEEAARLPVSPLSIAER